jgi:hypothetical protein
MNPHLVPRMPTHGSKPHQTTHEPESKSRKKSHKCSRKSMRGCSWSCMDYFGYILRPKTPNRTFAFVVATEIKNIYT